MKGYFCLQLLPAIHPLNNIKKIVVIGPESTGKSTLSEALAAALNTSCNPEYARAYLEEIKRPYTEADLEVIAKGQVAQEDALLPTATQYLICDTDLYVMKVWSEHSYGHCHHSILEGIAARAYDLYLLTDIDMPWTPDPQREHGEAAMRQYFFNQYHDIVMNSSTPWVLVSGNEAQRLATALAAIAQL